MQFHWVTVHTHLIGGADDRHRAGWAATREVAGVRAG